jgi:PPOX class probable F420-dependent enzyme
MPRRGLRPKEARFLARERVIRVATCGRDGTPWVVPVCHAVEDRVIYFGSDKNGRKVRNIAATKRVSLVADRYTDNWNRLRGVAVVGRGAILAKGPAFDHAVRLLYRKYPQYPKVAALEPGDAVIIRVTPTHVMSWE